VYLAVLQFAVRFAKVIMNVRLRHWVVIFVLIMHALKMDFNATIPVIRIRIVRVLLDHANFVVSNGPLTSIQLIFVAARQKLIVISRIFLDLVPSNLSE